MTTSEQYVGKILILGPPKAGKTTLSRILADYMEDTGDVKKGKTADGKEKRFEFEFSTTYTPTKAVRIQEFESHELVHSTNKSRVIRDIEIHLWDVSGDRRYEDCWPAIKENADGVIFVVNPEEHSGADLKIWYKEFIEKENISLKHVMVILNEMGSKKTNHEQISSFEILPELRGVTHVAHHFASEAAQMKVEINDFMAKALSIEVEKNDVENIEDEF